MLSPESLTHRPAFVTIISVPSSLNSSHRGFISRTAPMSRRSGCSGRLSEVPEVPVATSRGRDLGVSSLLLSSGSSNSADDEDSAGLGAAPSVRRGAFDGDDELSRSGLGRPAVRRHAVRTDEVTQRFSYSSPHQSESLLYR